MVTARSGDRAIGNAHAAGLFEMHEPMVWRQRPCHAVERETRERHVLGANGRDQRFPAGEDEAGRAGNADQVGAGGKPQAARGGSAKKPFCDGTHARIGFRSE